MSRFIGLKQSIGLPPGTLVHVGEQKTEQVRIFLMTYGKQQEDELVSKEISNISELALMASDTHLIRWVNVVGLHQIEVIEAIGEIFAIHPLLLEDILNTQQRAKVEQISDELYLILKMLHLAEGAAKFEVEQVSIILGKGFVITFQEQDYALFESVRQRIRAKKGRIRDKGADYLVYTLLDLIVDHYFIILEDIGEQIESVEEELLTKPEPSTLHKIHQLKREMLFLRRAVWPLREVTSKLQRGDFELFKKETLLYLRDVYEHTIQVIDTVETFRDLLSTLLDLYLSTVSNRMNEIMKLLTVISTLFIPLTFLTSLYGMNFRYMPELEWRGGYAVLWLVLLVVSGLQLLYFRKKGWL